MCHMKTASVRDLRYRFSELERLLREAEKIEITKRRRVIGKLVPPPARAYGAFHAGLRGGILSIKPWPAMLYAQALRLGQRWTAKLGIRSLDILHVASALALKADTFNTFDDREKNLARAAGLATL